MWSEYTLTVIDSVARNGSFSGAAQELHRVPSAISYSVKQVEEWLATALFERRHRDVVLTAAGKHFLTEARGVIKKMNGTRQQCQQLANGWRGHFSIAIDRIVKQTRVEQLVVDFYQHFPDIELHINDEVFNGVWDALADGRVDMAIGATQAVPVSERFTVRDMGKLSWSCVVVNGHPLHMQEDLSEDELRAWPSLVIEDTSRVLPRRDTWTLDNQRRLVVPNWQVGLRCVLAGQCVAMMPTHIASPLLAEGRLVSLPISFPDSPCCLSWRENRFSPALQWALEYLGSTTTLHQEWLASPLINGGNR
ncbi:DNA-binding transcriptional activator PunR [Rosenbergiella collisarenosi]|uniref:DNA-binding transcriptional activator PunR n=1 Tax=Rosenbergiella collisarenosi TaxID=1544695 RepID=UPI001BD9394C|nr:DNA-binding transcriptional activator PunR [Rosenbergiella collisarenosi]MBT0720943.1 LysR family transcriptional regulator [Rosenbergiella collisarenosi]